MIIVITVDMPIPSQNTVDGANRRNRYAGAKLKQEWSENGFILARSSLSELDDFEPFSPDCPCQVAINIYRPDKARRDLDNTWVKGLFDGFTKAGVWTDDNDEVVKRLVFEKAGIDKNNPRIEFHITNYVKEKEAA